jgi:protein TonB
MAKDLNRIPDFDDIIFAIRNKDYGAYELRKKYSRNVIISLIIGIIIMASVCIAPFLSAMASRSKQQPVERQVEINMQNFEKPDELIPKVPPPPSQPLANAIKQVKQVKYVAPVVVDSVMPAEEGKLMTADESQTEVQNSPVVAVAPISNEGVQGPVAAEEEVPFVSVEEMPVPQGGEAGLYKFIAEHTIYPKIALDNNIQGKVYVKFCVTAKGTVDQVGILKGVDPELDAEAIRVVKSFPPFKPGKMSGKPVPVWYIVHIDFQLQ